MNHSESIKNLQHSGELVKCHEDGSLELYCNLHLEVKRTFGYNQGRGYKAIEINGVRSLVHRVIAKAYLENYDESLQVDHINGAKSDNRPCNLRMVSNSRNARGHNSKRSGASSKYRGVKFNQNRWVALCDTDDRREYLGRYRSEESAAASWDAVALVNEYHPSTLNFGVRNAQNLLLCALRVAQQNPNQYA